MKPLIVFDGNCQSHHLAAIMAATGLAETCVNGRDYGMIPSFRGMLCRYVDEAGCLALVEAAARAGRPTVQASQATPMAGRLEASYSSHVDRVARFPYLQFSPMLQAAQTTGRVPNYARAYEVDLQMIRLCQAEAGSAIDFAEHIETHHRVRPLFHMHVHPGPDLTQLLLRALCAQVPGLDAEAIDAAAREVADCEGINMFTQHPLPADLLIALGFDWPYWYEPYGAMIAAAQQGDYQTLSARRAEFLDLFGTESQFWSADFNRALTLGDRDGTAEAFAQLSRLSAGYIGIWYAMYAHGGRDPVVLTRAGEVFAGQRQLDQFLSRVASEEGRHDEAVALAGRYCEAALDLIDGVVPLVLALQQAGRTQDAERAGRDFMTRHPEHRRAEVVATLAQLPQPVYVEDQSSLP